MFASGNAHCKVKNWGRRAGAVWGTADVKLEWSWRQWWYWCHHLSTHQLNPGSLKTNCVVMGKINSKEYFIMDMFHLCFTHLMDICYVLIKKIKSSSCMPWSWQLYHLSIWGSLPSCIHPTSLLPQECLRQGESIGGNTYGTIQWTWENQKWKPNCSLGVFRD